MARTQFDFLIAGGGIVGLATAWALLRAGHRSIAVVEKEARCGEHQSGHNSGVIHSGIYYAPATLKAKLCLSGRAKLVEFCREHKIKHEICGKLIVATSEDELPRLEALFERGQAHRLGVSRMTPHDATALEPSVACVGAVHVPETGVVDFRDVTAKLVELLQQRGVEIMASSPVTRIEVAADSVTVRAGTNELAAAEFINCAGLFSDRLARLAGADPGVRIVPFRGEYHELRPERAGLVRHLIYPVPDPAFPFLGVHFTRAIDGRVHVGPNAVLAWAREGYRRRDVSARDLAQIFGYPGFWKLAARNFRMGLVEMYRSVAKGAYARQAQRMIPALKPEDLVRDGSGVRAQALDAKGKLVDDFCIVRQPRAAHVVNAPSPAATSALALGEEIAAMATSSITS